MSVITDIRKAYNLMLVKETTNTNVESYWQSGPDNDPVGNKSIQSTVSIIPHGNFRSAVVDDWFIEPPDEVWLGNVKRVGLNQNFSKGGSLVERN